MNIRNITWNPSLYIIIQFINRFIKQLISGLFIISYLSIIIFFLKDYLITDYTVWAAIILSPYIISPDNTRKSNKKYLWISLVFVLLAFISAVKTFYFLAMGLAILYVLESILGSVSYLPFFLLGLLSPTFKFFNNMLGFPIRLKLSEWAGNMLQFLGYKVEVSGNVLVMNGAEFSVDPACVGLKMMAVSILTGLLIMAYFQHRRVKPFHFLTVSGILVLIVGFNIAANLIRIMLLTIFQILPDNPFHEIVGIICFILYIILPSYFLIKWIANRYSGFSRRIIQQKTNLFRSLFINLILLTGIIILGISKFNQQKVINTNAPEISLTGYSKEVVKGDIIKLEKPGILIYIKPIQSFYGAEHSPMICWVGSGYNFKQVNKKMIGNKEIYTGILNSGKEQLFTAWWFDNGSYQTNSQIDWRWRSLKGENFYLINVSSERESTLMEEINRLL